MVDRAIVIIRLKVSVSAPKLFLWKIHIKKLIVYYLPARSSVWEKIRKLQNRTGRDKQFGKNK